MFFSRENLKIYVKNQKITIKIIFFMQKKSYISEIYFILSVKFYVQNSILLDYKDLTEK